VVDDIIIMSNRWHGGKGDRRRKNANDDAYRSGWNRIFGNEKVKNDDKEKDRQ
jgi:hypothetical protein